MRPPSRLGLLLMSLLLSPTSVGNTAHAQGQPGPASSKVTSPSKKVYLQPLGDKHLSNRAVQIVKVGLQQFYGFAVVVLPRKQLPRRAYYRPRRRYRAEKLLDYLEQIMPDDTFRVLGITAVDISTTKGKYKDYGIMGLASLDGKLSVMSLYRCRAKTRARTLHRFGKVAVHEIGHTLGLPHCPSYGCLMEDARGTRKTADREYVLCSACRKQLNDLGYRLPPDPRPPWPKPKQTKKPPR